MPTDPQPRECDIVDGRERCFGERQVGDAWVPCPSPVRERDTDPETRMEGLAGRPLYCADCLEDFEVDR